MNMLQIIKRITESVNATQSVSEALSVIVQEVKSAMQTDVCSCFLFDETKKRFYLSATEGLNPESVGLAIEHTQGLVGLVGEREEPINLEDASTHPNFYYVPATGEEKYHAFLGVPIVHARKMLGVLVVQQKDIRRFDESEEAFMVTISAQLAGLIAHATLSGDMDYLLSKKTDDKPMSLQGLPGCPGVAIGTTYAVYVPSDLESIPDRKVSSISEEKQRFDKALNSAREELTLLANRVQGNLPPEEYAIFDAYLRLLDSNSMGKEVNEEIEKGIWSEAAIRNVIRRHAKAFEAVEDAYLSERVADLKDIGVRLLKHLQKNPKESAAHPNDTILVGEEITAAHLAEVPREKLAGVVSMRGSNSSHVAIVARAMDIPIVLGAEDLPLQKLSNQKMIVDGYSGQVYVSPSEATLNEYYGLLNEEQELRTDLAKLKDLPAETPDGYGIHLYVNAGLLADISVPLASGAEGVGLYRTEIPFMSHDRFPTEEQQRIIYRQVLEGFQSKPVTIRTLDMGGDKPLSYFSVTEENPFLGWRGIRVSLDHPEIFLIQLRAMLKASEGLDNLKIMFPMVTHVHEVEEALVFLNRAYDEVRSEGINIHKPKVGVMIEVPSAVYQAREIARLVDFVSVGSNDLTQYLLAVDRNNPRVANIFDSLHPAVIRALKAIVDAVHAEKKVVNICGEMAGEPLSAILLIAMGYDGLSMNTTSLARVKWVIRNFTMFKAREICDKVLTMNSANDIRHYVATALKDAGLGGLVRAGKY